MTMENLVTSYGSSLEAATEGDVRVVWVLNHD